MASTVTIEAAKKRIASAETWVASAAQAMESAKSQVSASEKELKDANEYLKTMESALQVIVLDSDDEYESTNANGHRNENFGTEAAPTQERAASADQDTEVRGDDRKRHAEEDRNYRATRLRTNDLRDHLNIPVMPFSGETKTISAKLTDTVADVKAKIDRLDMGQNLRSKVWILIHTRKGTNVCKILKDDDLTVNDCGIKDDSILHVIAPLRQYAPSSIYIYLHLILDPVMFIKVDMPHVPGQEKVSLALPAKPSDTISKIKAKIQEIKRSIISHL